LPGWRLSWLTGAVVALMLVAAPRARAEEPAKDAPAKAANATGFVPADASFFSTMLRNKQQYDILVKSKAFKKLMELDVVKEHLKKLQDELGKEDGKAAGFKKFWEDKDNKKLVELIINAVSDEIFIYGGPGWTELLKVLGQLNTAQYASLKATLDGEDGNKAMVKALLDILKKNKDAIKIPEFVIGFKIKDAKQAETQITRLEKIANAIIGNDEKVGKILKGRLKRTKVGESNFLTLNLDGGMIPWDDLPIKEFEEKEGDFDEIIKHFKGTKLTVSLGVREGYLLFGITTAAEDLTKLGGKENRLIGRDEFKPLVKAAAKPITSVSYISKAFNVAASGSSGDFASMAKGLKELLDKAPIIGEDKKKAIGKDIDELAAEIKKYMPEVGARMGFDYLTDTGYEGFSYDYGKHDSLKGAEFKLLKHFGGNPILAIGYGSKSNGGKGYQTLVKWIKKFYGHAESIALDQIPDEDAKEQYKKATKIFFPLLQKLDDTTQKLLLPALKDGSVGLVLDAKWKSKKWIQTAPETAKAMPMLEIGLLLSLADADKFTKAMKEYRLTINDILAKAGDLNANIQEFKIPSPDASKEKGISLYTYKLPEEAGVDQQVVPTAGVSKTVAALSLSKSFTERLLAGTELAVKSGPLVTRKSMISAAYFNWPGFVDAATPWLEFSIKAAVLAKSEDEKGAEQKAEAILKQVKVGLEVLKCLKTFTSASYLEGGVLVTQHETVIKDLD
jgi:hypothetical protein